ncbi:MAG: phosphate-starvation-inducible PsiE family protein [Pseudonocardiaceae bacterium]
MLDRILLALIVAGLAYTLRVVIERHEIAAEPFLLIGVIAAVRRILIVTAEFEQRRLKHSYSTSSSSLGCSGSWYSPSPQRSS